MDLAELKFVVDTKQLETAATRVAELGTAVSKLNKPMQDLNKESAKNNKELSKAEEAAAKAALAQLKLQQAQEKSADSIGKSASVLERHNLIVEYQAKGYSKGQASIMATAKASGALDGVLKELGDTLKLQRTLMGTDPFDKSIGLMQKLQNETRITSEVNALFNKNLGLTEKQMIELAREKERLIALYGIEGRDIKELAGEYDQLIRKTVEINKANDARTNSMRQQVKSQNDAAKANAYLASEMERVNRLTESGGDMTSAVNNKLIRFEQALKQSGQTAAQQAVALEKYKASLMSIQKASGNRQVDYLSRALGPQITDIAVGLATGQAPLTVLLQQGGQLRDQFALAGVAGADMGKMLVQASKAMVSSVKDIGLAVGQLVAGAVTGTGKAVVNLGMQLTGTSKLIDLARNKMVEFAGANSALVKSFDMVGKALPIAVGLGIATVVTLLTTLAFKYAEVAAAEKELTKSLALSGAALGMSTTTAIEYAKSMNSAGVSTLDAMRIIGEFANTGSDASIPLKEIIKSAVDMEKYVGIATKDTVKAFSDISEKPVEGLINLAKSTGNVSAETILQAEAFVKAGKTADAARIAQEALKNSNAEVAKRMINDLDPLQTLWLDIKSGISGAGQEVYEFLKSSAVVNIFRTAWETVSVIVAEVWYVLKQTGNEISGIGSQIKAIMSGDFNKAADIGTQMKADAVAARAEQDKLIASIMNRNKAEKETLSVTEQQRVANRKAAKEIEDRIKREKAPKTDAEKEADKLEKDFENAIETAKKFYQTQIGAVDNLTKSEIALNKVREDASYKKFAPDQQKQIDRIYEEAKANEILKLTEDERKRDVALIADLYGKNDKMGDQYYSTLRKLDDAFLAGNVSLEEYAKLLNIVYKTSTSFKALESVKSSVGKNIENINADRQAIASQYGMDFKTEDEKASLNSLSKFKTDTLKSDAELEKNLSDAKKTMNEADYKAAEQLYKQENELQKQFLKERYDREQYQLTDAYKRNEAYRNSFESMFKGMGDAIIDFALTGKTEFDDMIKSMIVALLKLEMQMAMTNMYKSFGGSQGIISTIVSSLAGTPTPSAKGNVFNGGLQPFAKGGSFTNGIVNSPTMFNMGLMGEAGPEAIMPLRRGSDGSLGVAATGSSGGNVSVQVINNSNAQATTNETTDSKGNRKIEVIIGEMTAGEISRSGSSSQKSIKSTFGIQPQLIRR